MSKAIPTIAFTVRLPKELHDELYELKYDSRTSAQQIVIQAIKEFLQKNAV